MSRRYVQRPINLLNSTTMETKELISLFTNITVWKQGEKRAPHKPLLILYLLGRILQSKKNIVSFTEVDENVGKLLNDFGPGNKTQALYPFWYLQNDGFWHLSIKNTQSKTIGPVPNKGFIRKEKVTGSFTKDVYSTLANNPIVTNKIIQNILNSHFPTSIHEDILSEIGITTYTAQLQVAESEQTYTTTRKKRDPKFREKILRAYEYKCAVCGFGVRMDNTSIGLEAAHIKWHQAGGPDKEHNGLALCALHHKLFDRGAFTLENNKILISENANGDTGFTKWLMNFHGQPLRPPQRTTYKPLTEYTDWHYREIFRGEIRKRVL